MANNEDLLQLIQAAQINFVSQNLDIVHLAFDKVALASRPYFDEYSVSIASGGTAKIKWAIPAGELFVLAGIYHRDIEPGIFDIDIRLDGLEILSVTRLDTDAFLLPLAKAFVCTMYLAMNVKNNDTVAKTYKHLRIWHAYDKAAVNKFLNTVGAPEIK